MAILQNKIHRIAWIIYYFVYLCTMTLCVDTDKLLTNILEAFGSLDSAMGSLPAWEIDLTEIEESFQEFAQRIKEGTTLLRGIQPFFPQATAQVLPHPAEGESLQQTLLIMTIHFRADIWENHSRNYNSMNDSPNIGTIWTSMRK